MAWSEEVPTKAGWYWFYGRLFGAYDDTDLAPVKVVINRKGKPTYTSQGAFIYPDAKGGCIGYWHKAHLPFVPDGADFDVETLARESNREISNSTETRCD